MHIGYFVGYTPTPHVGGDFLFQILHDAGLDPQAQRCAKKSDEVLVLLCHLFKDHNNDYVKKVIHESNTYEVATSYAARSGQAVEDIFGHLTEEHIRVLGQLADLAEKPIR